MTVTLLTPALVSFEEAQSYLRDHGYRDANADVLRMLINAVTADVYKLTARNRLLDDDTTITEYRDGNDGQTIITREYPITEVTTVTLWPHETSFADVVTGPGAAVSNDSMIVDQPQGEITLKDRAFPMGTQTVQIEYKAGYATASAEAAALTGTVLELLQSRWQRYIEKHGNISTREAGDQRWTFKPDAQIQQQMLRSLRPWRRWL